MIKVLRSFVKVEVGCHVTAFLAKSGAAKASFKLVFKEPWLLRSASRRSGNLPWYMAIIHAELFYSLFI